jgi:hypothetical protein
LERPRPDAGIRSRLPVTGHSRANQAARARADIIEQLTVAGCPADADGFFELRTPRDMLEKARREYGRLTADFNIDNVFNRPIGSWVPSC